MQRILAWIGNDAGERPMRISFDAMSILFPRRGSMPLESVLHVAFIRSMPDLCKTYLRDDTEELHEDIGDVETGKKSFMKRLSASFSF